MGWGKGVGKGTEGEQNEDVGGIYSKTKFTHDTLSRVLSSPRVAHLPPTMLDACSRIRRRWCYCAEWIRWRSTSPTENRCWLYLTEIEASHRIGCSGAEVEAPATSISSTTTFTKGEGLKASPTERRWIHRPSTKRGSLDFGRRKTVGKGGISSTFCMINAGEDRRRASR